MVLVLIGSCLPEGRRVAAERFKSANDYSAFESVYALSFVGTNQRR